VVLAIGGDANQGRGHGASEKQMGKRKKGAAGYGCTLGNTGLTARKSLEDARNSYTRPQVATTNQNDYAGFLVEFLFEPGSFSGPFS
jgi:hypothetical protein